MALDALRVLVFSRKSVRQVERLVRAHGMRPVRVAPDVVLTFGGDGTLLLAEHRYPGVPKLPVGRSKTCHKCGIKDPEEAVRRLAAAWRAGKLATREEPKLMATIVRASGREIPLPLALNDVVVRNRAQAHALRFSVKAGARRWDAQIGDGVVVATPFGASGYFSSITRMTFPKGIGLAFNNPVAAQRPVVLRAGAGIELRVEREEGLVSVDTLERTWRVRKGDVVRVREAPARERARLLLV